MPTTGQSFSLMPAPLDDAPELCRLGVAELTRRYADRSLSPVEVARVCLTRAEHIQARFNAFTFIDHEGALAAAQASHERWRLGRPASPIDGVPTTIKDIVWVHGWTVRYGTLAMPGVQAEEDAPSVQLLRQAGAVLLGLTTTPEFGWKALTDSPLSGITRNPWDPTRTPGGSSGGAAVAAAAGAGVLHLGTDGGGSIRIPAAFTGVVGHKPTFGRVPAWPSSPFGTVAHIGPIARTVADTAAMLEILSGHDDRDWYQTAVPFGPVSPPAERDPGWLRVGVWDTPPSGALAGDVRAVFNAARAKLAQAGVQTEPVTLPGEALWELFTAHWSTGAAARLAALPQDQLALVEPGLREIARAGAELSAVDLIAAQQKRAAFGAAFERMLHGYDVVISPAVAVTPFAVGEEVPPGSGLSRWTEWAGFSYPVNLAQSPACVVPCGLNANGLPVGLQVIGRRGKDALVLSAAAAIERLVEAA
jgi:aspartyl-tRNA(Asn)/glutamyl-tRNA(Gln) amidotransferase subunit A